MDKNYFVNRLAAGESINAIGKEIADMMNAALAEHQKIEDAKRAEAEKEAAKRELVNELVEIVQELAILEGFEADETEIDAAEVDELVAAITTMFATLRDVKRIVNTATTDDAALHKFLVELGVM